MASFGGGLGDPRLLWRSPQGPMASCGGGRVWHVTHGLLWGSGVLQGSLTSERSIRICSCEVWCKPDLWQP